MSCFRCNTTKSFIFLLEYCQWKVGLKASKKSLVFVTIQHFIFTSDISSFRPAIIYKNFKFTQKTHLREDAAFLHFRLKESSENMRFLVKRKHAETNKKMIFPVFFTSEMNILFFMQWKVLIMSSKLCKREPMKCWHDQLKLTPLWKELWLWYMITLQKRPHEMLAWSTEMNTILKGTLTMI